MTEGGNTKLRWAAAVQSVALGARVEELGRVPVEEARPHSEVASKQPTIVALF